MHVLPVQPDDVQQQPLGQPVLAHDGDGALAAEVGELQVPVVGDHQQSVALHPGDGLADRRAALVQPLGDPGAQRNDALFLELEDGSQVHLGRVDQVVHAGGPLLGPRDGTRCGRGHGGVGARAPGVAEPDRATIPGRARIGRYPTIVRMSDRPATDSPADDRRPTAARSISAGRARRAARPAPAQPHRCCSTCAGPWPAAIATATWPRTSARRGVRRPGPRAGRAAGPGRPAPAAGPGRPAGGLAGRRHRRRSTVVVYDGGTGWPRPGPGGCCAGRGCATCGCWTVGSPAWTADPAGRPRPGRSRPASRDDDRPAGCDAGRSTSTRPRELAASGVRRADRRPGGGPVPRRDRAARPGGRAHPGRGQPADRRPARPPTAPSGRAAELRAPRSAGGVGVDRRRSRPRSRPPAGPGITACQLILAGEIAGLELALYPGSYSQWCALGRPVAVARPDCGPRIVGAP